MRSLQFLAVALIAAVVSAQTPAATKPKPAAAPKTTAPKSTAPKPAGSARTGAAKPAASSANPPSAPADSKPLPNPELDKIVISVGAQQISAREFETFIASLPEQYQLQARGPMRRQVAEQVARIKLLADEARRVGLDKDRMIQAKLQFQAENFLAGELYQSYLKSTQITEGDLRRYYADHKNEFESAKARHILIKFKGSPVPLREGKKELSEEEALAKATELRKRIEGGEDFAKLAKEESDDAGSGAQGGDLGSFRKGAMVPAFEAAVFALKEGELSQPVKTQFGYHIIRLDKMENKSFEEMKPELERRLKPEAAQKKLVELSEQAKIVIDDKYFSPDAALTPGPGQPPAAAPGTPAPSTPPAGIPAPGTPAPPASPAK